MRNTGSAWITSPSELGLRIRIFTQGHSGDNGEMLNLPTLQSSERPSAELAAQPNGVFELWELKLL
jgi:hypothetical protein